MYSSHLRATDLVSGLAGVCAPAFVDPFFIDVKAKLLHGEQFLSIKAPIPTSGDLVNEARYVGASSSVLLNYEGPFSYTRAHINVQDYRSP